MNELKRKGPLPAWMIWANPIVRRYCRSRLRPASFGVMLLLTILVAGFFFFVAREASSRSALSASGVAEVVSGRDRARRVPAQKAATAMRKKSARV